MKTSNAVLGVVTGAAVGALIGVMFAPDKGSNTREKIYKKGGDWMGQAKGKVDNLKHQVTGVVDKVADKIHSATNETKAAAENSRKYVTTER
jgi:gas vesicle protein